VSPNPPGGVLCSRIKNMPHVILRFRLPEEQAEFTAAMQGADAKSAIWQVDQYCRGVLKHGEPSAETRRHLEEIRETLRERPGLLDD
jgi:dihydroxyacetone kinase